MALRQIVQGNGKRALSRLLQAHLLLWRPGVEVQKMAVGKCPVKRPGHPAMSLPGNDGPIFQSFDLPAFVFDGVAGNAFGGQLIGLGNLGFNKSARNLQIIGVGRQRSSKKHKPINCVHGNSLV